MSIRSDILLQPESWQASLGLLPVLMRAAEPDEKQYVLLNGRDGNLCLDASLQYVEPKAAASAAWSCNVGHYLSVSADYVDVFRWDQPDKIERYTQNSVRDNLVQFHEYLERNCPDFNNGVVDFFVRSYRRLRAALTRDMAGEDALRAFLYLVACASEDIRDLPEDRLANFGLTGDAVTLANQLSPHDRDSILSQLLGVGAYKSLAPDLGLVVRHASGIVFEDAHRVALQPSQLWIPGLTPEAELLSNSHADDQGAHFTPPAIARTLAEEAVALLDLSQPTLRILDPACGSAELLKEVIRQLERAGYRGKIELFGMDLSSAAVDLARFTLAFERRNATRFEFDFDVRVGNALTEDWPAGCSLAIMNPPFKAWIQLTGEEQQILMASVEERVRRPNLAAGFFWKAAHSLPASAVLAAVAPKSVFESVSASPLREVLSMCFAPKVIARLGSQDLFRDATVDVGLYVGRKGQSSDPAVAVWADQSARSSALALRSLRKRHANVALPISESSYSVYPDKEIGRTSKLWTPRRLSAIKRWVQFDGNSKFTKASKIFDIKQGARMGDDVFVVTNSYLRELGSEEQRCFRPAVLNGSITDGKLTDKFYVFFPRTADIEPITTEDELAARAPTFYRDYLAPAKERLLRRSSLRAQYDWWDMVEPRNWQFERKQKIVSKYFGGEGSFAFDDSGDYVVVVGHAWIPDDDQLSPDIQIAIAKFMAVYLNLPQVEELIDYLSVRIGGGQLDLSGKYLKGLLIPNIAKLDQGLLTRIGELASQSPLDPSARSLMVQMLGIR